MVCGSSVVEREAQPPAPPPPDHQDCASSSSDSDGECGSDTSEEQFSDVDAPGDTEVNNQV